jgi:uncharacterized protein (DUF433 family)
MQVEEYLDFLSADDIRVKGTRVGVESVLYEHVHRGRSAEEIVKTYPNLSLEQVYAVLFYYHAHETEMNRYLNDWIAFGRHVRETQAKDPALDGLRARVQAAKAVPSA